MEINPMILTSVATSFITSLAAKGITGPAETLNDIWKATFGYPVHFWAEKTKLRYEANLKKFESELTNKILEIPKEQIQEPKISILGPALEASKYYFEEDEIREMFSNLISSSMDSTYNGIVQHSFVEIIKQMSPYDAQLFKSFFSGANPITSIIKRNDKDSSFNILIDVFYINQLFQDYELNKISINNLSRLGLIDIKKDIFISENIFYEAFENSEIISNIKNEFKESIIEIQKHSFTLSSLGKAFSAVCIKDSY